ncbi:MAG TPA: endonuclease/exonuclease/phosphatase family protein [Propionibacteriaceae bacterium]
MTTATWWSRLRPRAGGVVMSVLALLIVVPFSAGTTTTTAYAAPNPDVSQEFESSVPLRIGSFNVRCANCYTGRASEVPWEQRRGAVVESILSQDLDVLGVQEASQGRIRSVGGQNGLSQFEDLTNRLGAPWDLVNDVRYNCVREMSPSRCRVRDRGASLGTRILYNSNRIAVVDSGSLLLPETNTKGTRHYVAWAKLQQLDTGLEFMVSNSHFTAYPENHALRKRQAAVALAEVKSHNTDDLPLITLGDWNSSRFDSKGNGPYNVYIAGGQIDPLGGKPGTGQAAPTATVGNRVNTWLNSFNGFNRHAGGNRAYVNGSYLDYILTSPMRVSEWETVAKLDANGNFIGQIPSDHNLVRATVWLPSP